MSWRRIGSGLTVAAVAITAAACGSDNLYAAEDLEATIVDSQRTALDGLTLGEATCPDDVVLSEGAVVPCTLAVENATARYEATLTNVAAKDVTVVVQPLDIVIPMDAVITYVENNLAKDVADGAVACEPEGAAVVIAQQGQKISCAVAIGSKSRAVELEVLDGAGTVAFVD